MFGKAFLIKNNAGFNLVELLVVLAILSISFTVVGPNIHAFASKARLSSVSNERVTVMQRARLYSIEQARTVLICASEDYQKCDLNWRLALIAFVDVNRNQKRDLDEELVASAPPAPDNIDIKGPRRYVRFYEHGTSATPATFISCINLIDVKGHAYLANAQFISLQGRMRKGTDKNVDGIHEYKNGKAVSCRH